jgi:excisionase family DNA binding protein
VTESTTEALTVGVGTGAKRLGIGRDATYQLIREGKIRAIHIGRRIRIPVAELERFIEREAG